VKLSQSIDFFLFISSVTDRQAR